MSDELLDDLPAVPYASDVFVKTSEGLAETLERAYRFERLDRRQAPDRVRVAVRRKQARKYVLLIVISMAACVGITRLFLQLTGYPQVAGGELHIAHLLWGGLLIFLAALMTLLLYNRWVFGAAAILTGLGIGLFLDEIGKVITRTNDYFYPPAAPIIYLLFLLTVRLYLRVRRPVPQEPRAVMYCVLEDMNEVLDRNLDTDERADLLSRLAFVQKNAQDADLARLAGALTEFLSSDELHTIPPPDTWSVRLGRWARSTSARYFPSSVRRALLAGLLLLLAMLAFADVAWHLSSAFNPSQWGAPTIRHLVDGMVAFISSAPLLAAWTAMEGIAGVILLVAACLLAFGRDNTATRLGWRTLLFYLVVVDLLAFYYLQFAAIVLVALQFLALWAVRHYRRQQSPPGLEGEGVRHDG
jgi:hypothetical protein